MDFVSNIYNSFFHSTAFYYLKILLFGSLALLGSLAFSFALDMLIFFVKAKIKYKKRIPNFTREYKQHSLPFGIFFEFPKYFWRDFYTSDPNIFPYHSFWLLEGSQGCGKTISAVWLMRKLQYEYPQLRIRTNFDCSIGYHDLYSFEDLQNSGNGIYGELDILDELQTWFSAQDSKNFPPEMLSVLTQQRHVRRCIIGISQRWQRIAKPFREQCLYLLQPKTYGNVLTHLVRYQIETDTDGMITKKTRVNSWWFFHDDELRKAYNSYSDIDFGQKQ